ncbi:MAG: hypothetical protein MZU95_17410 [Desulfomicrobium escambiense]|nr:hypothetical protein [Desulfomicrobium escambiense]MCK7472328.1 hypothetical protein [Desulfomicrobium escambiense]
MHELKNNHPLIIISSNDSPTIQEAVRLYKFNGIFQEILGSDFMFSKKEKILYAAKKYSDRAKRYLLHRRHNRRYQGRKAGRCKDCGRNLGLAQQRKNGRGQTGLPFQYSSRVAAVSLIHDCSQEQITETLPYSARRNLS